MIRGAEKHHPLGFKQHPLEDAGKEGKQQLSYILTIPSLFLRLHLHW